MTITPKTTLAELEQWANDVRAWPCKPTSITLKFFGGSGNWAATLCMPGGPVIGHGRSLIAAINDALSKVQKNEALPKDSQA